MLAKRYFACIVTKGPVKLRSLSLSRWLVWQNYLAIFTTFHHQSRTEILLAAQPSKLNSTKIVLALASTRYELYSAKTTRIVQRAASFR